jgi:hypothetical protein
VKKAGIPVRDTWNGFKGENLDDGISNNGHSGGQRLFGVVDKKDGKTEVNRYQLYEIQVFKSIAYDNYKLHIPKRYKDEMHPVVHETVHFLQQMTLDEDQMDIPLHSCLVR